LWSKKKGLGGKHAIEGGSEESAAGGVYAAEAFGEKGVGMGRAGKAGAQGDEKGAAAVGSGQGMGGGGGKD